jgi:hypothetical protein
MQTHATVGAAYLAASRNRLNHCVARIRHCVQQMSDEQVWWRPRESMNSTANILLHLCGNLRQWILSGVGGAPDARNRPQEFAERTFVPGAELLAQLEEVAAEADAVMARLTDADLLQSRRVQGFDETVLSALYDTLTHLNGHTQEIIYITRLQLGDAYRYAWAPTTPEQGAP